MEPVNFSCSIKLHVFVISSVSNIVRICGSSSIVLQFLTVPYERDINEIKGPFSIEDLIQGL